MVENFIITHHILKIYKERIGSDEKETKNRIKKELHFTKVKRIINDDDHRYIFTTNSKEFIFKKGKGIWILKTVIKRSRKNTPNAINRRLAQLTV